MTRRIIWFDPGGTTGWATWSEEGRNGQEFTCGHLGPEPHHDQLDNLLGSQQTDEYTIGTESFEYRNKSRAGLVLDSVEYIGVIRRFAQERMPGGDADVHYQTASMGKVVNRKDTGFVRPGNLKKLGLWFPGYPHAMDAYGHLLYYIIHHYGDRPLAHRLLLKGWK